MALSSWEERKDEHMFTTTLDGLHIAVSPNEGPICMLMDARERRMDVSLREMVSPGF
jgi:hypothetical protein